MVTKGYQMEFFDLMSDVSQLQKIYEMYQGEKKGQMVEHVEFLMRILVKKTL